MGTEQNTAETNTEVWYVCKSFSGSQFTISIPNPSSYTLYVDIVTAYAGSGYSSEFVNYDEFSSNNCNGNTLSVPVNGAGDFVYGGCACGEASAGSITQTYGTLTYENDMGSWCTNAVYGIAGSGANQAVGWTWSSDDGGMVSGSFKAVVAGTEYELYPADNEGISDGANRTMEYVRPVRT